jgi:hypothetical protein
LEVFPIANVQSTSRPIYPLTRLLWLGVKIQTQIYDLSFDPGSNRA